MWNKINTGEYEGMIAETICIPGHEGRPIRAYYSRPLSAGPFPGIVLIPHAPGWDEWFRETARRFTQHGYSVLCPDLYSDYGDGLPGEVAARARAAGGVSDKNVMEDCEGALCFLRSQPNANGRIGVIGMCSGGRHTFLAACTLSGIDAAVDCWGGGVVSEPEELTPEKPVSPSDCAADLSCPLLGVFGDLDHHPTADEVDRLDAILNELGKDHEFLRYKDAGHGFWCYDKPGYNQAAAMESWNRVFAFFDEHLKQTGGTVPEERSTK